MAPCLSLFSPLFATRRPGVRIPSRPPSLQKGDLERAKQSYRGTLGLTSLPDSFRYLVIHPERHCLSVAASVNTSRLPVPIRPTSSNAVFLGRNPRSIDSSHAFGRRLRHPNSEPVCVGIAEFDFVSPRRFFDSHTKFLCERMNVGNLKVDECVWPRIAFVF